MLSQDHLRLNREELYQLVWSKPMQHVAKDYGISDRAMAKLCLRKQVPVPSRGYWARKLAGGNVIKSPLPEFVIKAPKIKSKVMQDRTSSTAGKEKSKTRSVFEDRNREIKGKLREFRRSMSNDVHYVVKVEGWDCDFTFGLNANYNPLHTRDTASFMHDSPYNEYRILSIKGVFLKPEKLKGQKIEADFHPSIHLDEAARKKNELWYEENPPKSVGLFQNEKECTRGIISIPAEAMNFVQQAVASNKVNYISFRAEKMHYGHAEVHRYSLQEKYEDE